MTAPERGTATLSPELARRVGRVARARVAAGRSWTLYLPEHPALKSSVDGLTAAIRGTDPRVLRSTVRALAFIDDRAAARASHTVLGAATGEHRLAVAVDPLSHL